MIEGVAARLREEAKTSDERRLLVLAGSRESGYEATIEALDAAGIPSSETVVVSRRSFLETERITPDRAAKLLGTTHQAVVIDCHDMTRPNVIGQTVGAVDGGGLLLLVTPAFDAWPTRRDTFDERLAVPPATVADVTGHFRRRLIDTLRAHRGVAIVDADAGTVERDGIVGEGRHPRCDRAPAEVPDGTFPSTVYAACLTADQARAVTTMERLRDPGHALVLAADRGRGKSSAAGIAGGALAAEGLDVLVTAPGYRNARELFDRAVAVLDGSEMPPRDVTEHPRNVALRDGGQLRYLPPTEAASLPDDPDVVLVDEAAALPVHLLSAFLAAPSVAFATTIHGYEGTGRGFAVRFRDRLDESDLTVTDVTMTEPIRYAAGDPVEAWAFRALLLDARPAVDQLVAEATLADVSYGHPDADTLLADEQFLREAFGLLVLAHYRTEPDDLARMLDAPNLSTRVLTDGDHVLAVALVAREGDLDQPTRDRMYGGDRIRGNMIPDILTAQLRDVSAASLRGRRIVRIATHPAIRRRGFGSRLLAEIRAEWADADWIGAGFGATPDLVDFWRANDYRAVHLATTRNETSGEHSVLLLAPVSDAGGNLVDRHAAWFVDRVGAMLTGPLRDLDPDVVRTTLAAIGTPVTLSLSAHEWRHLAGAAAGTAHLDTDPAPFRRLAIKHLVDPADPTLLTPRAERLLVSRVLQGQPAAAVATELAYPSSRQCMRALGATVATLLRQYGQPEVIAELDRLS